MIKRHTIDEQKAAVSEYLTSERTAPEIAAAVGVSESTLRRWVGKWKTEFDHHGSCSDCGIEVSALGQCPNCDRAAIENRG